MPEPLYRGSQRLPATYANFYIGNRVVLAPVFGCPQDRAAVETLGRCFPDRRVLPIDSRALVVVGSALSTVSPSNPAPTRTTS